MNLRYAWCLIIPAVIALVVACPRHEPPPPAPIVVDLPKDEPVPWTWHRLGGLMVVEGEAVEPIDLVLKGRYLNEHRHAELGPVRWEIYAPPPTEVAELRTTEGKLLARWDFSLPPPKQEAPARSASTIASKSVSPSNRDLEHRTSGSARDPDSGPLALPEEKQAPIPLVPLPSETLTRRWPGSGEAFNLLRGPKGSHQICLTFDAGSTAEAALDVLDALKARNIQTTFFLTGSFIRKYPELVKRIAQEGHEIGNHTLNHPHFAPGFRRDPRWTKERFQMELLQADAAFFHLTGRPMDPYWRAPYGEQTSELRGWAEELGYRHVGWSEGADTLDWATTDHRKLYRSGDAILERLRERMGSRDGSGLIVLMHLGSGRPAQDRPASVLGPFLDEARRNGWNFVNVGAYMHASGRPRWDSMNRLALLGQTNPVTHTASRR